MINFICYKKCTTCQKAAKFLREAGIDFTERDYTEQPLSIQEITKLYKDSGLPLTRLFNTSGQIYRQQNIKEKLPNLTEVEQIKLLSENPKLIKRPILQTENKILIGFKENEYKELAK